MSVSDSLTVGRVLALLDRFAERVAIAAEFFAEDLPDYRDSIAGRWFTNGGWTEGFWPGLLWRLYEHARSECLAGHARRATRLVATRHANTDDHDLGFLFGPSCVLEHELTGDEEMLPHALAAAERLSARYLPGGSYIPAHGPAHGPQAGFAIIDTMMNLPLLLWAARRTGRNTFEDVAIETARTIAREHVRPDGSSCQVLWLDPATGRTLRRDAIMAVSTDSCWARGQAWGVHGFARMYRECGYKEFASVAARMADYFLSRVPEDGIVFHDLDDPDALRVPKDTSAQTVAAGGLLLLAESFVDSRRARWCGAAERLLRPLLERCLVEDEPSATAPRGLLGQGCKSLRKNQGVVSEIVFGDFYLVETLQRWLTVTAERVE